MKKILVVDDEQDIRDYLQKRLVKSGYDASSASNGQEALERCRREAFDLVLMDIAMPVMDGYEACKRLKEDHATASIPVMLLTSKDLDPKGIAERMKELDVAGYVTKPATVDDLLDRMKQILS